MLGSTSKASGTSSAASSAREETKEELVKRCKEIMNSVSIIYLVQVNVIVFDLYFLKLFCRALWYFL